MDCTDIVIGFARKTFSQVGDYYTRDRSTPVIDEALGGHNDLIAAYASEVNETTTLYFRRSLIGRHWYTYIDY